MSKTFYDIQGNPIEIKGNPIAHGGEAEIYEIDGKDKYLAKIYTRELSVLNKYKLFHMSKKNSFVDMKTPDSPFSFPVVVLFGKEAQNTYADIVGYIMPRKHGENLHNMLNLFRIQKGEVLTKTSRLDLVDMLLTILTNIKLLHSKKMLIGDLSLKNILYDEDTKTVSIIDCDSYQALMDVPKLEAKAVMQIHKGERLRLPTKEEAKRLANETSSLPFFCEVHTEEFCAPELMNTRFNQEFRQVESELFSIAVLIFKVLMLGEHPLLSVKHSQIRDAITNMEFPYNVHFTNDKLVKNKAFNAIWSYFPQHLRELFSQAFAKETLTNPQLRPTIDDWIDAMTKYRKHLTTPKFKASAAMYQTKRAPAPRVQQKMHYNKSEVNYFSSLT